MKDPTLLIYDYGGNAENLCGRQSNVIANSSEKK
jgi:hypothetical protein